VGKGGLIVGAASGHGAVYKNGIVIGMASMKQLDLGAQIGGKAYSEVIFFKTDKALEEFMNDDLQFSGNVAAIAVNQSAPSINLKYDDGIAVFTLPKEGLMAEVSVGGQKFDFEDFD
jgi:lipid-binding SYLF domain-containing protein